MKIVVDSNIPYIKGAVEQIADEVDYVPGCGFSPQTVADADALIVRTRTRCDRSLLEGSKVRFIATATIGFDHIDVDYCRRAGIAWANAPGCNASSVGQYVQSALLLWERRAGRLLRGQTLGIVGAGHVGRCVESVGRRLGMRILLNDPPRQEREGDSRFVSLEQIARESDVVSFHVPLDKGGRHNTFHLADKDFFGNLRRRPLFMNTSRGEVADTAALLDALASGQVGDAVVDTWEDEPCISRALLERAFITTPHIAGYSADGKANATRMALESVCRFFHISATCHIEPPQPPCRVIEAADWTEASLRIYNPQTDSRALKSHPEWFERLRNNYPLRREWGAYEVRCERQAYS